MDNPDKKAMKIWRIIARLSILPILFIKMPVWLMILCYMPICSWMLFDIVNCFKNKKRKNGWYEIFGLILLTILFSLIILFSHYPYLLKLNE